MNLYVKLLIRTFHDKIAATEMLLGLISLGWVVSLLFAPDMLARASYAFLTHFPTWMVVLAMTVSAAVQLTSALFHPARAAQVRYAALLVQTALWAGIAWGFYESTGLGTGVTTYSIVAFMAFNAAVWLLGRRWS